MKHTINFLKQKLGMNVYQMKNYSMNYNPLHESRESETPSEKSYRNKYGFADKYFTRPIEE